MSEPSSTTTRLQRWIDRIQAGDASARDELIAHFEQRLRHLARRQLKGFPGVRRWEQTDDVFVNASVRLLRTLEKVRPASVSSFLNLASEHIRRELIDLYRHHCGPHRHGAHHATTKPPSDGNEGGPPAHDRADVTWEPAREARWAELHEKVAALPQTEREVFGLLWYQGLTQEEAAAVLNVSRRSVIRHWQAAQLRLREALRSSPLDD
jgi:RNA polymerase sigma-70 factor (ECF subfamily)